MLLCADIAAEIAVLASLAEYTASAGYTPFVVPPATDYQITVSFRGVDLDWI